jgi:hypothetical protein
LSPIIAEADRRGPVRTLSNAIYLIQFVGVTRGSDMFYALFKSSTEAQGIAR